MEINIECIFTPPDLLAKNMVLFKIMNTKSAKHIIVIYIGI